MGTRERLFFFFFTPLTFCLLQELIGLIRSSKIPIICMCNDRNHTKIRSLANYCFDLRFQRPRVEQIKVRARSPNRPTLSSERGRLSRSGVTRRSC